MKKTTVVHKGQVQYTLDESMHNIKNVKVAQKKVPFKVYLDIGEVPYRRYEM